VFLVSGWDVVKNNNVPIGSTSCPIFLLAASFTYVVQFLIGIKRTRWLLRYAPRFQEKNTKKITKKNPKKHKPLCLNFYRGCGPFFLVHIIILHIMFFGI
jgi:hypothetical protein